MLKFLHLLYPKRSKIATIICPRVRGRQRGTETALSNYVDDSMSKSSFVENPIAIAEKVKNYEIGVVSVRLASDIMANKV